MAWQNVDSQNKEDKNYEDLIAIYKERIEKNLFDKQLDFIKDTAKRKILVVGRQGGKSFSLKNYLILSALSQKAINNLYISLTRDTVKQIMMRELEQALIEANIAHTVNNQELWIRLFNGSIIYFKACNNESQVHRVSRGLGYKLIVVDEAGYFPNSLMQKLMIDGLEPTLLRFGGEGTIVLACTATDAFGYFYEQWNNPEWKQFFWTIKDNPGIPNAEQQLEAIKKRHKYTDESPTYKKEYLGIFQTDTSNLVYGYYKAEKNHFEELPQARYEYGLGIDFGVMDSTAITVTAFNQYSKDIYLIDEFTINEAAPSQVAEIIKTYIDEYNPISIAADVQGQGKAFQQEYYEKYKVMLPPADKTNKNQYIQFLNDDVISGTLKIKSTAKVLEEWQKLDWVKTETKKYENPRAINHLSDSLLYNVRAIKRYWTEDIETPPNPLGEDTFKQIREKRHQAALDRIHKENKEYEIEYNQKYRGF